MKFFLDNCLSPHHADGLRGFAGYLGHEFKHLREIFDEDTADVEWITALGKERGWIILSGDSKITRNPAERAAWHESRMTAFFFTSGFDNLNYWKKAAEIMRWWQDIQDQARKTPEGHGFYLPWKGNAMQQIYPASKKKS